MKYLIIILCFLPVVGYAQEKTVEYVFNENDSTYQLTKTTIYDDGSYITIGEVPLTIEDLENKLFEAALELENTIEEHVNENESDSLEFLKIVELLQTGTGVAYADKLEAKIFAEFEGRWTLKNDSTTVQLRFKNKRFRDDIDSYRITIKSNNEFILRDYFGVNFKFRKRVGRWIAKLDEERYVLRKK